MGADRLWQAYIMFYHSQTYLITFAHQTSMERIFLGVTFPAKEK